MKSRGSTIYWLILSIISSPSCGNRSTDKFEAIEPDKAQSLDENTAQTKENFRQNTTIPDGGTGDTFFPAFQCNIMVKDLSHCFVGLTFAECPGPYRPAPYCSVKADGGWCRWISNGCPVGNYQAKLTEDCTCDGQEGIDCPFEHGGSMASFWGFYGGTPWDRKREMNISVQYDSAITYGELKVDCTNCVRECLTSGNPCMKDVSGEPQTKIKIASTRIMPGAFVQTIRVSVPYLFAGWQLLIEADLETNPPVARACRIHFTDAPQCKPGNPICAQSGTMTLNVKPDKDTLNEVNGTFSFIFPDGLKMEGNL